VWRELEAKAQRGEEISISDQFDLLQKLSPEGKATYSYEGTVRAVVLENPNARIPLPSALFRGRFDQRWRFKSDWLSLDFIGSELERLREDGVPFIFV
jgi:hypothetical protein